MKSVRIFWDLFGSLGILGPSDTNVAPTYAQHSNVRLLIGSNCGHWHQAG